MPQPPPTARRRRRLTWIVAVAAIVVGVGVLAADTVAKLRKAQALSRASEPFQRPLAQPRARLLVLGDSTGVGTGARNAAASVAGRLAAAFPGLAVDNRAQDGATLPDVLRQLDGAPRADVVLVQAGGNDVIRLKDIAALRTTVTEIARRARALGDTVVLMPAGNVGNAPLFFPPLSWLMSERSRRLHALVREVATELRVLYVDLFREHDQDPFVRQPGLNADDGLHPSAAGYGFWFEQLMTQADLGRRLAAAKEAGP